jgi:hypothetical protein
MRLISRVTHRYDPSEQNSPFVNTLSGLQWPVFLLHKLFSVRLDRGQEKGESAYLECFFLFQDFLRALRLYHQLFFMRINYFTRHFFDFPEITYLGVNYRHLAGFFGF